MSVTMDLFGEATTEQRLLVRLRRVARTALTAIVGAALVLFAKAAEAG